MPPSSRKRNKGKERKAKKKEENDKAGANRIWRNLCRIITGCDHGCDIAISDDHPVSNFMDQFYMNLHYKRMTAGRTLLDTLETNTQILSNASYKKLAIGILVRIGTNLLLGEGLSDMSLPIIIVQSILVLEHYNGTDDNIVDSVYHSRAVGSKIRYLEYEVSSIKRDLLKFYRKRTSCKCLKRMHLEARKTMPKMGYCWHCNKEMERASLSVCSRCMIIQYCSRECQVAAWPEHKSKCDVYVKANRTVERREKLQL